MGEAILGVLIIAGAVVIARLYILGRKRRGGETPPRSGAST
jgi:hypothetical protein